VTFSVNEHETLQAAFYTGHHNMAVEMKVPQISENGFAAIQTLTAIAIPSVPILE
jgi:hypothetical protein